MSSSSIQPGKGVQPAPNRVQQAYVNISLVLTPAGADKVSASLIVKKLNGGHDSRTRLWFSTRTRVGPSGRLLPLREVFLAAVQDMPTDL